VAVIGVQCWAFSNQQVGVHSVIVFLCLYVLYILVRWNSQDIARTVKCSDESDDEDESGESSESGESGESEECDSSSEDEHNHKHGHDVHDANTLLALPEKHVQSIFLSIL